VILRVCAAAAMVTVAWLAWAQSLSRQEIENALRYEKRPDPAFSTVAVATLEKSIRVAAGRSYAVFGYNIPTVRVELPPLDNSGYAVVNFLEARPLGANGKPLAHELEQGLYSPETHSSEIRFVASNPKDLVPIVRAAGRVAIRYPIRIRTTTVRVGSPEAQRLGISFDGPYVKYPEQSLGLPGPRPLSGVDPMRAYDRSGKRLELYDGFQKSESADGVSRKTIAFWGPVATIRFDTVEQWSDVQKPFDLPAAPKRPAGREGIGP